MRAFIPTSASSALLLTTLSLATTAHAQATTPPITSASVAPTTFNTATFQSNSSFPSNGTFTTSPSSTNTLVLQGTRTLANTTAATATAPAGPRATCNGYVEFCERRYSNITEVCAHNSAFIRANNLAANQAVPIVGQLNDGIRMIQGQTHYENGTMYACHTSCDLLNAGPIQDQFTEIRQWLDNNRYEVVTLLIGNSDFVTVENYTAPLMNSGLRDYAYIPPKVPMNYTDWPTMSEMILSNKRLVIFMDYNANQTAVPYILDQYTQMWETPFSPTNIDFPCNQERPANPLGYDTMYLHNHNLNVAIDLPILTDPILIPNLAALPQVNSVNGTTDNNNTGSLGLAARQCRAQHNQPPRFLVVDYYNVGNGSVFQVAAEMNGVTYNRPCCGLYLEVSAATMSIPSSILSAVFFALGSWWVAAELF